VYEQTVALEGEKFRQLFILDLGLDEPTILLTNDRHSSVPKLMRTKYRCDSTVAHTLPSVLASGLLDKPVAVPWWNGMRLRLTA
jgi:hypothetical protein